MSDPTLHDLFAQLGLDNSPEKVSEFIRNHQLPLGASIDNAFFFDDAQTAFIRQAWLADAEWVYAIEQLNIALHQREND